MLFIKKIHPREYFEQTHVKLTGYMYDRSFIGLNLPLVF